MNNLVKHRLALADQWVERNQFFLAAAILFTSALPFLYVINAAPQYDVHLYHEMAVHLVNGKLPYQDFLFEYPPYSIPLFAFPLAFGEDYYTMGFKLLAIIADAGIKCLLLVIGLQNGKGIKSLAPVAVYSFTIPFLRYFYLQRYDVFPAFVSLLAFYLFCSKRYMLSGLMVSIGIGLKLYPFLFAAPLLFFTCTMFEKRRIVIGFIAGATPMLALGFWLPWWKFLIFHNERGLQAESIYASAIWFSHRFWNTDAVWEGGKRCLEVHGPIADLVIPWSRVVFIIAVLFSTLAVCRSAFVPNAQKRQTPQIAGLLLIPLLAFVGFNQVFSPQFMIWLLPLAAVTTLQGTTWTASLVTCSAIAIPIFYPSYEYGINGLNSWQTTVLLARNLAVIAAWVLAFRDFRR